MDNYYKNLGYVFAASVLIHLPIIYNLQASRLERTALEQERQIVKDSLNDKLHPLVKPQLREKNK